REIDRAEPRRLGGREPRRTDERRDQRRVREARQSDGDEIGAQAGQGRTREAGRARHRGTLRARRPREQWGGANPALAPHEGSPQVWGSTIWVGVTTATSLPASVLMRVCQICVRRPRWIGVASPIRVAPVGAGAMKLVLLSIVVVHAPSGRLTTVPVAP